MMPAPHGLTLHQHHDGTATTITLAGEMDLSTAPAVRAALAACIRPGIHTIDIDLTDLTFCDIAGLDVLLSAADHTAAAGGMLRLHHPQPEIVRVLDLTGTSFLLHRPGSLVGDRSADGPHRKPGNPVVGAALWQARIQPAPSGWSRS